MNDLLWGIDLGGTKIEGVVLNTANNGTPEELVRLRIPTEQQKGYDHIINQIELLVTSMQEQINVIPSTIGIGTPGVLDPQTALIKNSNTECLRGKPLLKDIQAKLECDIRLANDANCFALAEARFGAAKDASCVFGVIMGTGVGGGIVLDGSARYGLQGICGEFGHVSIDPAGPDCYCGKKGCVETFMSGPALEVYYESQTKVHLPLKEIFSEPIDDSAQKTKEHLLSSFGAAIATVVNILDPDVIVLGGGASNLDFLYTEGHQAAAPLVFNSSFATPIVKNELGDSAGVYGAACLF